MAKQHEQAKNLGYKFVVTHTSNKYRSMLILSIKTGFEIVGIRKNIGSSDQSILLEKAL